MKCRLDNFSKGFTQGTRIKVREMALVWHEKASHTALQTGSLLQTHTLLVQTHTHDYSQGKCRTMSSIIIKLKLIFKLTIGNKQMYSPRLYKYQESSVLYTPTVQLFSSLLHTYTLLVQTHKHDVSAPCNQVTQVRTRFLKILRFLKGFTRILDANPILKLHAYQDDFFL